MPTLGQYSIVCQVPGSRPFRVCAYSGTDLSQALGISQAASMPEGSYGWIQQCGEVHVRVGGETQAAYADFRPNDAKLRLGTEARKDGREPAAKPPPGLFDEKFVDEQNRRRLAELPPLLIELGPYCNLLREARDVFVAGYFYACVAMCGISLERFQRDKAKPYGAEQKKKASAVRKLLDKHQVLRPTTLKLCKDMADLRDQYAHGHGANPQQDALKALGWMHAFIEIETDFMRDYVIKNGTLYRKAGGHAQV